MNGQPRTLSQQFDELREAWLDVCYAVLDALGVVAYVHRHPSLRLRGWAQARHAKASE